MTAILRGIAGGDDAGERARRQRIGSLVRRGIAAGEPDRVVVVVEGSGSPVLELMLTKDSTADDVTAAIVDACEDDSAHSRESAYRVLLCAGETQLATGVLRVRAASRDEVTITPGQSMAAALQHQLMRHNEATMRLFADAQVKTHEVFARMLDRQGSRLDVLERRNEEQADRRMETLRLEMEARATEEAAKLKADLQRQTFELLKPALPSLMRKIVGGPPASSSAAPHEKLQGNPKSSANISPADSALSVLSKQPREAIEVLASMLEADDAAKLLAAYDAAQPAQQKQDTPKDGA